jgi:hypothetical protein
MVQSFLNTHTTFELALFPTLSTISPWRVAKSFMRCSVGN